MIVLYIIVGVIVVSVSLQPGTTIGASGAVGGWALPRKRLSSTGWTSNLFTTQWCREESKTG